jgi:hypothetical protein
VPYMSRLSLYSHWHEGLVSNSSDWIVHLTSQNAKCKTHSVVDGATMLPLKYGLPNILAMSGRSLNCLDLMVS